MAMKTIDVQPQPLLSFGRTFRLALAGVRYRLFRASVTVAVIAVAMAFLANILTESLIKSAVAGEARDGIREIRVVEGWIAKLSVPADAEEIIARIAAGEPDSPALREAAGFAGTTPEASQASIDLTRRALPYLEFFEALDYGRRRVLVRNAEGIGIFDLLSQEGRFESFRVRLQSMKSITFPGTPDAFAAFLSDWPSLRYWLEAVREGQAAAIRSIHRQLGEGSILEALTEVDNGGAVSLRQAGFVLDEEEARVLARQAQDTHKAHLVESNLARIDIRKKIGARRDLLPSDVNPELLWDLLRDPADAAWLLTVMKKAGLPGAELDATTLTHLAESKARVRLLTEAELSTTDAGGGIMGLGKRMSWLAFVSMLVCVVGIANAMLMSVTERFREIATLKCLGALDGFIMTVFLIEAAILGLAGGILGALGGTALGIGRMSLRFKSLIMEALPAGELITAMLVSVALGIVLAAISAVYPSFRAARLAPMEAMRIE